jgi:glycosyltransferase involved in cell wall biosynthesis
MQPLVSIVVPTYNRMQYLPAAIDSVLAQTFESWELIIADDGSDDETRAYLQTLERRSRISVLQLTHSGNPGAARNAALRAARGEYVAFLDSDDTWMPTKLEVQLAALRASPDCHWSYTDHVRVNEAGQSINSERNPNRTLPDGEIVEQLLRLQAGTPTPTIMAERKLIERAGGFDEQQGLHEDYDLWLRLALLSKVLALREPLACVRRHGDHFSSSGVRSFEARLRIFAKMHSRVSGLRLRSALRAERAREAGRLAAAYAACGDIAGVWGTIVASCPYSWRSVYWNAACIRAVARVLAPQWLLMFVRQARQAMPRP